MQSGEGRLRWPARALSGTAELGVCLSGNWPVFPRSPMGMIWVLEGLSLKLLTN